MRYEIVLTGNKRIEISADQYPEVSDAVFLSSKDGKSRVLKLPTTTFDAKKVHGMFPVKDDGSARTVRDMSSRDKMKQHFLFAEEEYRKESAVEKAKRDYYTRFMGIILSAYGTKNVFGSDYESPLVSGSLPFDREGSNFGFTDEQRQDRHERFDAWVAQSNWSQLWGKDLKNFLVEYFQNNPSAKWCPLDEWVPLFVHGKVPVTYFEKILNRHEAQYTG